MRTEKFELVLGTVPGYFHNNEFKSEKTFGMKLQEVQAGVFDDTGLYVSIVARPAKVSYHSVWGCPVGGEDVFLITGTRNPEFAQDKEAYRKTVELLVKRLMGVFHQSTATLEWQEVDLSYFKR